MARRRQRRRLRPLPLLLAGFLVGVMILLVVHWREHERQRRAQARPERPVALDAARIEPSLDGRRVRAFGVLRGEGEVLDPVFGARAEGVLLLREVAMWQWHEERSASGEVQYRADWSERLIPSARFVRAASYPNPERMPFSSELFRPARVRLGRYLVPAEIVDELATHADLLPFRREWLPENLQASFIVWDGALYTAADPHNPAIGDLRIRFRVLAPVAVELEAIPHGARLEPMGKLRLRR